MHLRYTKHFLYTLESLMSETQCILRYERGNFQSGYCLLKNNRVAIVNKFLGLEGKINSLLKIIKTVHIDNSHLSPESESLYQSITNNLLTIENHNPR